MDRPIGRLTALLAVALMTCAAAQPQYVTILHFNDFHGQLLPRDVDGRSIGGMARIATMVDETRDWNVPHGVTTLLLQAGDILQGTPLSTVFQDRSNCCPTSGVTTATARLAVISVSLMIRSISLIPFLQLLTAHFKWRMVHLFIEENA